MAGDFQKFIAMGRLTRDPEKRTFQNGGAVAQFGFAFTGQRKKNESNGQWEDEPCFIDCKAFNSTKEGGRKLADTICDTLAKGRQILIEGHFILEQWTTQSGDKRQALKLIIEDFKYCGPKPEGAGGGSNSGGGDSGGEGRYGSRGGGGGRSEEDIPF